MATSDNAPRKPAIGALLHLGPHHFRHLLAAAVPGGARLTSPGFGGNLRTVAERPLTRAVVLVEGQSDKGAVEALARRRGRNLDADGVAVIAIGGASRILHFLTRYGPDGDDLRLAGLCDAGEEAGFRRGLERAGLGSSLTREGMERLGFFVCEDDLEDELIRALGTSRVEQLIDQQGELAIFRTFQRQPAQRGRSIDRQLRRFMGTLAGRKIRYAPLLVDALDLDRVPSPLDGVLAHVSAS